MRYIMLLKYFLCTVLCLYIVGISGVTFANTNTSYTLFEAGQVRPLALSPNGKKLFALNTPDGRLEVFKIRKKYRNGKHEVKLIPRGSVLVGLEPVALAVRSNNEVWVVNHLSDSISIVRFDRTTGPYVSQTLLVGDEPRDIVFAGKNSKKAFITTAHRGQNHLLDPQLSTPGVGRADVWVFNARKVRQGATKPENIITLFTDSPRALAVSADRSKVYAAGFKTGNQTTSLHESLVPVGGGLPGPRVDIANEAQPSTSLIVKFDGQSWVDEDNRSWNDFVKFSLPDKDVFSIDAMANPAQAIPESAGVFTGVGTVLFNMVVNPVNGAIYVSNTDARNDVRFEGSGNSIHPRQTVQGDFIRNQISVLKTDNNSNTVNKRHLNKHIDYNQCCESLPNDENAKSIAQPVDMVISSDGSTLYVAGFGSQKVAVYDTAELESDTFVPSVENQIRLTGGGPSGLALDENRGLLFVLTRFDNSVTAIDLNSRTEVAKAAMYSPEPSSIIEGRRLLYDASHTSSRGNSSCAGCHIYGDMDQLAWDLGDPDATTIPNPGPFFIPPEVLPPANPQSNPNFRALRGPMTTQSLRGMANHGAMHWRGDRTGGNEAPSIQPDSGTFDEDAAFKKFDVAFEGLVGRSETLTEKEIQAFTDFALELTYPPNPIRNLDNSLTPEQTAGRDIYFGAVSDSFSNCAGCHILNPNGNAEFGVSKPGFFGSDGRNTFEGLAQFAKVPHLRNLYQKIGMFGMPATPQQGLDSIVLGDNEFMGDQIKGFGFLHSGSIDTVFRFMGTFVFIFRPPNDQSPGNPGGFPRVPPSVPNAEIINAQGNQMRRLMEQFLLAFDSNLAPIVGQQITLTNHPLTNFQKQRFKLLRQRAKAGECDLVASQGENTFLFHRGKYFNNSGKAFKMKQLRYRHIPVTLLCTPPGSGKRIALNRYK